MTKIKPSDFIAPERCINCNEKDCDCAIKIKQCKSQGCNRLSMYWNYCEQHAREIMLAEQRVDRFKGFLLIDESSRVDWDKISQLKVVGKIKK